MLTSHPHNHKKRLVDHATHPAPRLPPHHANNRPRGNPAHPPLVLVDPPRTVGEPFDLSRAAPPRRVVPDRIPYQHVSSAEKYACRGGARPLAATRVHRPTLQLRRAPDHGHHVSRGDLLLSRRAARRTSRPQHLVLEVAPRFRSHHR